MRCLRRAGALGVGLLCAIAESGRALAHVGEPLAPHDLATAWADQPLIVAGIALAATLYGRGWRTLRGRARPGRLPLQRWALCYAGGLIVLVLALGSPLDALSSVLFSAHMVQHLLLILLAAPLLVAGAPGMVGIWALAPAGRRRIGRLWRSVVPLRVLWRVLTQPLVAWSVHAAALWLWHLPVLYQAALGDERVHVAEHLTLLISAVLFWWVLIDPRGQHVDDGIGVLYVFATAMQSSALGALITLSPSPWYPVYVPTATLWGVDPLADQQVAGLLMWIPTGVAYLLAALGLLARWMQTAEARARAAGRSA